MPDDVGAPARDHLERSLVWTPDRRRLAALGLAACLCASPAAAAETFSGAAEVQYQSLDRSRLAAIQESWNKILQLDYGNVLPGAVSLTSSFRFVEQTVARQSDRVRVPEGRVMLAHRNFGLSTSFRPTETRDSRGFTTRQQDLTVTGYAQRAKLPSLAGSWVRSRFDPSGLSAGSSTVSRSLSSNYSIPHVTFRAGYGDRFLEEPSLPKPRLAENHISLGSASQFQIGRAPVSLLYDYSQARARGSLERSQLSQGHSASGSTSFPLGRKAATSMSYNYRRTLLIGVPGSANQEHNGGASVSYTFNPVLALSGGAGVRSAVLAGGRTQTERFVAATASAQGQARPGWQASAAFTHAVNWLPEASARPSDNLQTATTMHLTKGLDLRGDFSIATSKPVVIPPDTLAFPRQFAMQSGVGLAAYPLRTVYLDANVSRSHAGASLRGGFAATSYSTGLRLTPAPAMQISGRWGLVEAPGSRNSTAQAAVQWTLASAFQLSAAWNRGRQDVSTPTLGFVNEQESMSGTMTIRLARDLNGAVQYNESNRGRPNRARQLTINVVRRFGS